MCIIFSLITIKLLVSHHLLCSDIVLSIICCIVLCYSSHYNPIVMFRNNEAWKEGRYILKNQILPRNVYSYLPGLNGVYSRFIDYLRNARDASNMIGDFGGLMPKLLTEGHDQLVIVIHT